MIRYILSICLLLQTYANMSMDGKRFSKNPQPTPEERPTNAHGHKRPDLPNPQVDVPALTGYTGESSVRKKRTPTPIPPHRR